MAAMEIPVFLFVCLMVIAGVLWRLFSGTYGGQQVSNSETFLHHDNQQQSQQVKATASEMSPQVSRTRTSGRRIGNTLARKTSPATTQRKATSMRQSPAQLEAAHMKVAALSEMSPAAARMFKRIDRDGNGVITRDEMDSQVLAEVRAFFCAGPSDHLLAKLDDGTITQDDVAKHMKNYACDEEDAEFRAEIVFPAITHRDNSETDKNPRASRKRASPRSSNESPAKRSRGRAKKGALAQACQNPVLVHSDMNKCD